MREFASRKTDECPTGEHTRIIEDPDDPTRDKAITENCTCTWMVIRDLHPGGQSLVWPTKDSLIRLIAEFDRGNFDPPGMPPRRSAFMSPYVTELIRHMDRGDILGAALRLLARVAVDKVTWDDATGTVALRVPFDNRSSDVDRWVTLTFAPGRTIQVNRLPGTELPEEQHLGTLWQAPPSVADVATAAMPTPGKLSAQVRELLQQEGLTPNDPPYVRAGGTTDGGLEMIHDTVTGELMQALEREAAERRALVSGPVLNFDDLDDAPAAP